MKKLELRSVMIDLGRQIESPEFLKSYADFIKQSGYNAIVLYLEASVRTSVTPFIDEDKSYSLEQLKDIVDYMEDIGLDVIPAFENMFHMERFFVYKELEDFSELTDEFAQGRKYISPRYKRGAAGCVTNEKLTQFTDKYITEVCSVFKSKYVHMGLDEIFEFAECERCKKVLQSGKTKKQLFLDLILRNYALCRSLGKEMMMWDDFFEYYDVIDSLPRDIIFASWSYGFVGSEITGKWTGRTKRDWFRVYEEKGFRYVVCSKANNVAAIFNIDSYNRYAEKYNPLGGMMTTWERSDCFYDCLRPPIAYGGKVWSGEELTNDEKIDLYASYFDGDRHLAELFLNLYAPEVVWGSFDVTSVTDGPYHVIDAYVEHLRYVLEAFEKKNLSVKDGANPVMSDLYDNLAEQYNYLTLFNLGTPIFDDYENNGVESLAKYEKVLSDARRRFNLIKENALALWEKDRKGVVSRDNSLLARLDGNLALVDKIENDIRSVVGKKFGVLSVDLMLPDTYGVPKAEIIVKYVGDDKETVVFDGGVKTRLTIFDVSGRYSMRFRIENREVEYVKYNAYGEGDIFPTHFSVLTLGKRRDAVSVEKLSGSVKNENNVLSFGVAFAELGYGDGEAHLNDMSLAKKKSSIKLTF